MSDFEKQFIRDSAFCSGYNTAMNESKKKLEEAKEIIKKFCGFCSVFNSSNGSFDNLIEKAEAFLKE